MATVPVPPWLLGRHVTTVTLVGMAIDIYGVLTDSDSEALVGQLDEITLTSTPQTENIQAMDIRIANYVILEDDFTLTLSEILKRVNANILYKLQSLGYDYFHAIITRGTDTWDFYGLRGEYAEQLVKGKATGRMTFHCIYPGDFNPALFRGGTPPAYTPPLPQVYVP
jgi:hypothetical protein